MDVNTSAKKPSVFLKLAMSQRGNFYVCGNDGEALRTPDGKAIFLNVPERNNIALITLGNAFIAEKAKIVDDLDDVDEIVDEV